MKLSEFRPVGTFTHSRRTQGNAMNNQELEQFIGHPNTQQEDLNCRVMHRAQAIA